MHGVYVKEKVHHSVQKRRPLVIMNQICPVHALPA